MKRLILIGLIVGIGAGGYFLDNQPIGIDQEKSITENKIENQRIEKGNKEEEKVGKINKEANGKQREIFIGKVVDNIKTMVGLKKEVTSEERFLKSQIENKYKRRFKALAGEYQGRMDGLIGQAKAEYFGLPAEEREKNKYTLGFKYLKRGKALESECDGKFEAILEEMEKELKVHGFSTESVEKAKGQYEEEKNERQKYFMNKALGK